MVRASRAGRKAKRNRQHYINARSLARYLGLHCAAVVKQIMNDPRGGFAIAYEEYRKSTYKLRATDERFLQGLAAYDRRAAPRLDQVITALDLGELHGRCKYSDEDIYINKEGWRHVDHCAKFLYDVSEWHRRHWAGLWFQKWIQPDKIYEIFQKIWQMFLRENLLRTRKRKAGFFRTSNGGGPEFSRRVGKGHERDGPKSLDDGDLYVVSKTNGGMRIFCDEIENWRKTFCLTNVADMTYEQVRNTISSRLSLEREKLRLIALWRVSDGCEITNINFDDYKHDLLTGVPRFDGVELETAPAYEVDGAGHLAFGSTIHIASVADLMDELGLDNDEVRMDVDNDAGL